jgi:hypothetical protein
MLQLEGYKCWVTMYSPGCRQSYGNVGSWVWKERLWTVVLQGLKEEGCNSEGCSKNRRHDDARTRDDCLEVHLGMETGAVTTVREGVEVALGIDAVGPTSTVHTLLLIQRRIMSGVSSRTGRPSCPQLSGAVPSCWRSQMPRRRRQMSMTT